MDPISVTASIVGLLGATAKVYDLLELISSAKNAPAALRDAQLEVKHVEIALRSLQRYLQHLDLADARRRQCIQVDELVVALSDAMLVLSDFESLLALLARLTRVRVAMSWFRYSKQIGEHVARTQRNKATLMFMLNILQCESDLEATQSQVRLQMSIEQILADNMNLRLKIFQMQDTFNGQRRLSSATLDMDTIQSQTCKDRELLKSSLLAAAPRNGTTQIAQSGILGAAFERILEDSWVYKRSRDGECDRSFIHSDVRSHAWSCFSGYSLADISILSVISMPLTRVDIANGKHYNPGFEPDARDVYASVSDKSTDTEVQNSKLHGQLSRNLADRHKSLSCGFQGDLPCTICGKILHEGMQDFEQAGFHWHLDCFSCVTCGSRLDSDASLLLLGGDTRVCSDCTYHCAGCGDEIEDLAIATGDRTFCAGCFRCRICQ